MDFHYTFYYHGRPGNGMTSVQYRTFILSVIKLRENYPESKIFVHTVEDEWVNFHPYLHENTIKVTKAIDECIVAIDRRLINPEKHWAAPKMFVYKHMPLGDVSIDTDLILLNKVVFDDNADLTAFHIDWGVANLLSYNAALLRFNNDIQYKRYLIEAFSVMEIVADGGEIPGDINDRHMVYAEQGLLYKYFYEGNVQLFLDVEYFKFGHNYPSDDFVHVWGEKHNKQLGEKIEEILSRDFDINWRDFNNNLLEKFIEEKFITEDTEE